MKTLPSVRPGMGKSRALGSAFSVQSIIPWSSAETEDRTWCDELRDSRPACLLCKLTASLAVYIPASFSNFQACETKMSLCFGLSMSFRHGADRDPPKLLSICDSCPHYVSPPLLSPLSSPVFVKFCLLKNNLLCLKEM